MVTFYADGRDVVTGLHEASKEDGDVGYFALLEDREVLLRASISVCELPFCLVGQSCWGYAEYIICDVKRIQCGLIDEYHKLFHNFLKSIHCASLKIIEKSLTCSA